MKFDQYISLIRGLEKSAASNRGWYEIRVMLLTMLGYGYFFGLILLMFAPIAIVAIGFWYAPATTWDQILLLTRLWWLIVPGLTMYFGFLGTAVLAITAKVPDPEGTEIQRSEAPKLFEFVNTACKELKAKKPKKILIDDSFNAAVVTMPKLGIFGRKVILLLGLPMMKALSPEQLKAVLAHEIGHISGKHGLFTKWAYQMREAWGRLIESQELAGHKFSFLYKKFVEWYFPYFTAYSFVLMREHEREADREAVNLVGKTALGEALILVETKERSLAEEFWAAVREENITNDKPTLQIFSRMIAALSVEDPDRSRPSLEKALAVPTDLEDTHPSLADRLRAIGYWTDGELPPTPRQVKRTRRLSSSALSKRSWSPNSILPGMRRTLELGRKDTNISRRRRNE
ncbi:MAG: peptidase M48, Ste24p [Acidobacteria bacterium OLB17]|nr:MAG: peptidase M48, Ste24p [Acidobacteria bacterium OLB17]